MRNYLAILLVVGILSLCGTCVWGVLPGRNLGSFDLGEGYTLRVWSYEDVFDLASRGPCFYYQVTRGSREVHYCTYLGPDRGEQFDFKTAFADSGQIACVYNNPDVLKYRDFFMFDLRDETSYPRHTQEDERGRPIPKGYWEERFRKLREENPGLPRVRAFEGPR